MIENVLRMALELGYRHGEGVARRLLAEVMATVDTAQAAEHLRAAESIFRDRDARNELAKVWVAQACLRPAAPDRGLLAQALALFRELGTVDEPARVERLVREAQS